MAVKKTGNDVTFILQLAVSIFFIILGFQGIHNAQNPGVVNELAKEMAKIMGTNNGNDIDLITMLDIAALVPGALLLLGLFKIGSKKVLYFVAILVMLFWGIRMVSLHFVTEIVVQSGSISFTPGLQAWLLGMAQDIVILCSILNISRRYA